MKALLLTLTFALCCSLSTYSQNKFIVKMWEHTTGQPDTIDWSATVKDGTYTYVTGNTYESGEKANILTTKYNSSGGVVWEVSYNSSSNDNDYGTAIEVDASGNVYIAAASYINSTNNYDYRVIKYNSSGTLQWNSTYNGTGSLMDIPTNLLLDGSGNVYVTGGSIGSSGAGWDYATVKYNSLGTQQWVARYNYNSHDDVPGGIAINSAGKILVSGGSAQAADNWDIASVKYNPSTGAEIDSHRNSASGLGLDQVYGVAIDINDNLYIAGKTSVIGQGYDMTLIKLDSLLGTIWTKTYDLAGLDDEARGVVVDGSSNVYITGIVTTADEVKNFMTIKYNVSGTLQWANQQGSNNGNWLDAEATDIAYEDFGDIYVTGTTDNGANLDFMTIVYSPAGTNLWIETYDAGNNDDDVPYFVSSDDNGEFYVGGRSENNITRAYTLVRYKKGGYTMPPDDDVTKPAAFTYFENKGQIIDTEGDPRDDIKYYTTRVYPAMYFTDDTVNYVFSRIDTSMATDDTLARIGMNFYNSSSTKSIRHVESQGGEYLNFFLAHTGANGITNVQHSNKLYETDIYPHVDAMYYFDNAGFKYYLIIKPGYNAQSDPILINYDGATPTVLTGNKLELAAAIGTIVQKSADAYQISGGAYSSLAWDATYTISSGRIGFSLGTYDHNKILILEFSIEKLLGGGGCEGNVLWGTLYGGNGYDVPGDVAIGFEHTGGNELYLTGTTRSQIFPDDLDYTGSSISTDIFIQKFQTGTYEPIWGTLIGGSDIDGGYYGVKLAKYGYNMAFVSLTQSTDLPTKDLNEFDPDDFFDETKSTGYYDGIMGIISASGSLNMLTYLGGDGIGAEINSIVPKSDGGLVIVGKGGGGTGFPFKSYGSAPYNTSGKNGFIIEFENNLHIIWSTLLGASTSTYEELTDISIDNNDDLLLVGSIFSSGLPTTIGCAQPSYSAHVDLQAWKIDHASREVLWCTYYGEGGNDNPIAITVDADKNVYIVGDVLEYEDSHFPLYSGPNYNDDTYNATFSGDNDGFILKFDDEGNVLWSTYFGGTRSDDMRDITSWGNYIAVTGSITDDDGDFPLNDTDCPSCYFDDQPYDFSPDLTTAFLSVFDGDNNLQWSTFLGDSSISKGGALCAYNNVLYLAGSVKWEYEIDYHYQPICYPGGGAYYVSIPTDDGTISSDGEVFVNAFDIEYFPSVVKDQPINKNALEVYPNPSNGEFMFVFDPTTTEIEYLEVRNILGEIIFLEKNVILNNGSYVLSIDNVSPGIYFFSAKTFSGNYTANIIKI